MILKTNNIWCNKCQDIKLVNRHILPVVVIDPREYIYHGSPACGTGVLGKAGHTI